MFISSKREWEPKTGPISPVSCNDLIYFYFSRQRNMLGSQTLIDKVLNGVKMLLINLNRAEMHITDKRINNPDMVISA